MAFKAKIQKSGMGAKKDCVTITTGSQFLYGAKAKDPWGYFGGRKVTFKVCPIANGIQIARGGRRGGARSYPSRTATGGMTMCTARGEGSRCLRGTDFIASPGGGARFKRRGQAHMLLNGFGRYRRRRRR